MQINIKILLFISIAFISSCKNDDSITSSVPTRGFIINNFTATIAIRKFDSLKLGQVSYDISYHYSGYYGSIDNFSFTVRDRVFDTDYKQSYFTPPEVIEQFTYVFMIPDSLVGGDSIKVVYSIRGKFWEKDTSSIPVDSFIFTDSINVRVQS